MELTAANSKPETGLVNNRARPSFFDIYFFFFILNTRHPPIEFINIQARKSIREQ